MWLHIPSESEVSARALKDSGWELRSPSDDPELWCYASGTAMQQPLSWHGWKDRPWIRLLSGIELTPSQQQSFTDAWTSSLRAIPANHSVSPDYDWENSTQGTSGPTSSASSTSPGRKLSFWKTSPDIYGWDSDPRRRWEEAVQASANVRGGLRAMGYRLEAGLFTAEEVGTPHERKRLFILAYRTRRGLRMLWESLWCNGLVDGSSEELEHPEGQRPGEAGKLQRNRPTNGNCWTGQKLPDPEREPLGAEWINDTRERSAGAAGNGSMPGIGSAQLPHAERSSIQAGLRSAEAGRQTGGASGGCGAGNGELGISIGQQHAQRRSLDGHTHAQQPPSPGAGIPLFPPGRTDFEAWARVRELRPDLWPSVESGVRMLADGPSPLVDQYRVEQARCIGNAVVPTEAALAFTVLVIRAGRRAGLK